MDGRGYQIPQNYAPEGYRCLLVYIPDDDEYLSNINGHIHDLTKWLSHEKEENRLAAVVASKWREAYELTMECGWQRKFIMSCNDAEFAQLIGVLESIDNRMQATTNQLVAALSSLSFSNQMDNIYNNCVDCGDLPLLPPPPLPPPLPEDPPPTGNTWEEHLCLYSQYAYDVVLLGAVEAMFQSQAVSGVISATATIAILAASGIGLPLAVILTTITIIGVLWEGGSMQSTLDEMAAMRDDIVCLIVNSSGSGDAVTAIGAYLEENNVGSEVSQLVNSLLGQTTINAIFDGSLQIGDYTAGGCGCDEYGGYILEPVTSLEFLMWTHINNGGWELNGNRLHIWGEGTVEWLTAWFRIPLQPGHAGHAAYFVSADYAHDFYDNAVEYGDSQGEGYLAVGAFAPAHQPDVPSRGRGKSTVSIEMQNHLGEYTSGFPGSWTGAMWDAQVDAGYFDMKVTRGGGSVAGAFDWVIDLYLIKEVSE